MDKEIEQEIIGLYKSNKSGLYISEKLNIDRNIVYNTLKENKITKTFNESAMIREDSPLDYNSSYLSEEVIEWIDGFLLGDGYISEQGRASCGLVHEEFCKYMMSGLKIYDPSEPKFIPYKEVCLNGSLGIYDSYTRTHPDLKFQRKRWYKNVKVVPSDVRITPKSVMLWFLGDGTMFVNKKYNTIIVRLSTDSFSKEEIEDILIKKLKEVGIKDCIRTSENRIRVNSKSIADFFNFIGKSSPIKCYDYKFNVPFWRFSHKRCSDVSKELGVKLGRLQHLIKTGSVPCLRLKVDNGGIGRPLIDKDGIEICKKLIQEGELY